MDEFKQTSVSLYIYPDLNTGWRTKCHTIDLHVTHFYYYKNSKNKTIKANIFPKLLAQFYFYRVAHEMSYH